MDSEAPVDRDPTLGKGRRSRSISGTISLIGILESVGIQPFFDAFLIRQLGAFNARKHRKFVALIHFNIIIRCILVHSTKRYQLMSANSSKFEVIHQDLTMLMS